MRAGDCLDALATTDLDGDVRLPTTDGRKTTRRRDDGGMPSRPRETDFHKTFSIDFRSGPWYDDRIARGKDMEDSEHENRIHCAQGIRRNLLGGSSRHTWVHFGRPDSGRIGCKHPRGCRRHSRILRHASSRRRSFSCPMSNGTGWLGAILYAPF